MWGALPQTAETVRLKHIHSKFIFSSKCLGRGYRELHSTGMLDRLPWESTPKPS